MQISDIPDKDALQKVSSILVNLGMIPLTESSLKAEHSQNCKVATFKLYYSVMLDGRILGHVTNVIARKLTDTLRYYKVIGEVSVNAKQENTKGEQISINGIC